jgi:hypothetical protein
MGPRVGERPWWQRTGIGCYNLGGWAASGVVGSYTYLSLVRETVYFWLPSLRLDAIS